MLAAAVAYRIGFRRRLFRVSGVGRLRDVGMEAVEKTGALFGGC